MPTNRVDFRSRYTKAKGEPPDYPGQPVVPLVLVNGKKHIGALGLLDTGSTWTIIGTGYANALGLAYTAAPKRQIFGLNKTRCVGYEVELKLVFRPANYAWGTKVVVSTGVDGFPFVILGHIGFFDEFDVTFQTRLRHFHMVKHASGRPD